jgi:xanthine/uracil/vitamin C permease (AzgA family)
VTDPKDSSASRLFDLRLIIGALFVLYGVVLTIVGVTDSDAEVALAAGVRINLWIGLGMLATGIFFLLWVRLRPLHPATEASAAAKADAAAEPDPAVSE